MSGVSWSHDLDVVGGAYAAAVLVAVSRCHRLSSKPSLLKPCFLCHTCEIEHEGGTRGCSHLTSPPRGATRTQETTQNTDKEQRHGSLAPSTAVAQSYNS